MRGLFVNAMTDGPRASCPTCGAKVVVVQGDEGTAHYEPTEGHLAREWEQRWEGENVRADRLQAALSDVQKVLDDDQAGRTYVPLDIIRRIVEGAS